MAAPKAEHARDKEHQRSDRRGESVIGVEFKEQTGRDRERTEQRKNPGADRHGRAVLENAQHVEKKHGPPQVHDEKNGRNDRTCGGDPKRGAHQIELAEE